MNPERLAEIRRRCEAGLEVIAGRDVTDLLAALEECEADKARLRRVVFDIVQQVALDIAGGGPPGFEEWGNNLIVEARQCLSTMPASKEQPCPFCGAPMKVVGHTGRFGDVLQCTKRCIGIGGAGRQEP